MPLGVRPPRQVRALPPHPTRAVGGVAGRVAAVDRGPVPASVRREKTRVLASTPAKTRVAQAGPAGPSGAPQAVGGAGAPGGRGVATAAGLPRGAEKLRVEAGWSDRGEPPVGAAGGARAEVGP